MLQILRLLAHNFGSFPVLELELSTLGLVLVRGLNKDAPLADSNGSGKSMILEALVWCLWGQTIRGLKADDVVNQAAGKDCFVEVTIEEDGHIYRIRRQRLMSGEKANNLFFFVDGQDSSKKDMAGVQEQIDNLLGMNFDTFCAMMPGAKVRVAELTDAKIKELLESLLQTEKFAAAYKLARDKEKELTLELKPIDKDLPSLSAEIDQLNKDLDEWEAKDKVFADHTAEQLAHWKAKRTELSALAREYEAVVEGRDDLDKRRASLRATQQAHAEEFKLLNAELKDFLRQAEKTKDDALRNITIVAEKLKRTNSLLEEIATMDANCAHCHQNVPEQHKEAVRAELLNDQRLFGAQHRKLTQLLESFTAGVKDRQADYAQRLGEIKDKVDSLTHEIRDVERTLTSGIAEAKKNAERARASVDEVDKLVHELSGAVSPYDKLIDAGAARVKQLKAELTQKTARKKELDRELQYVTFWVDSFSPQGLRSHLLEHVTPYLNEQAAKYADLLTDGELCITFHTQSKLANGNTKEKFYIDVQQSHGADNYKGASDGEKRRADIAIAFALGDLAALRAKKTLPFRFLDEPFENLDESGIQAVVQLLKQQAEQFSTVFVITHNDQLKSVFQKEILVQKQNGESQIVENPDG